MALDGIFLHSICSELKSQLIGGKIDKVNQPEKDEIVLFIRNLKRNFKLSISVSSVYPKIHLTNLQKSNPIKAPMYCMILRKYLIGAKIKNISQVDSDRILIIDFESSDELGFESIYSLIIEIMGRHSNISLVRHRDMMVMDSIKHLTDDMNSFRTLLPGVKYVYPPKSNKLSPFNFTLEEFKAFLEENNLCLNEKNVFSKIFTGVSTAFSKEITFLLEKQNISISLDNLENVCSFLKETIFSKLLKEDFSFNMYIDSKGIVKDFYCIPLETLSSLNKKNFESASEVLEEFYFKKDKADRLKDKSSSLSKLLSLHIERCEKKLKILNDTLKDCEKKEDLRISGELLTANIYSLKTGMDKVKLLNYYKENEEYIEIPLDEFKTPSQNVQSYYKKYNKLKKAEESALVQISLCEEELNYLYSVLTNLINVEDYESIEDIKFELKETGYIKAKKEKQKVKASKPLHFISSSGYDIYVGKNNIQNDHLTLKFADKRDLWLHTKEIPGSHVIIKSNGNSIDENTLNEAANLAAYYSKGKESSKIPVDYTEVKNVKKPNGAKPGMVIYYTNKTLFVTPKEPSLEQLK